MCRKSFALISILVLSMACASHALVIGDFEDGLGGWGPGSEGTPVLTVGTTGVTSGAASLDLVTGGGYWTLQYDGPALDMSEAIIVQLDVTMRVADFPDGDWTQFDKLAINTDLGWQEFAKTAVFDRDTGAAADAMDWGTWSGDKNLTIVWDITGADWTGLESSSIFQVIVAVQDNAGTGVFHIDNVQIIGAKEMPAPAPTVPFSLHAAGDIELGNDAQVGPDGRSNGSGLGARDVASRRRVILISYDISELKGRGDVSEVSLSNFSHDQNDEVNVYGIVEDQDLLDVESLTWNTAPGVKNDPAPELDSPVMLDPNDLTDVLLTFAGPGEAGVRFSTDASQALADFINSDTDGIITLLISAAAPDTQLIIRSREQAAGGSFLEGRVGPKANIVWVSFHEADDMASAGAAGAGFTVAPDKGYTDLLEEAGYNVTRYLTTGTPDVNVLNVADVVIISRSVNSGNYGSDAATIWNGVSTPMIITGGYPLRSSRMGFTTGTTIPDTTGDITLGVTDPNHPIFAGIALTDGTMDNSFAGIALYPTDPNIIARGISVNTDPINAEGTILAMVSEASAATGPAGGMIIGEWPAGAMLTHDGGAGTDILAGPRLVFLTGSREASGISSETAGIYDLYPDGAQMFLNAVAYMVTLAVPGEDALVASYHLDGDVTDSSGNMLDGIIEGDPNFVEGQLGQALQLDGIDDYVECGTDPLFDMTTQVSISAWVRPNDIGNGQDNPWVGKGDVSYALKGFRTGNVVEFFVYDGGWFTAHADVGDAFNGEWHQAAGTYDGAQLKVYIDGALAVTSDHVGAISLSTSSVNIGKNSDKADRFYDGAIDEVGIYSRALTDDEIARLHTSGL